MSVEKRGVSFVSDFGIYDLTLFRFLLKTETAELISLRMAALFANTCFTPDIEDREVDLAEFASNLFIPATILFRSD